MSQYHTLLNQSCFIVDAKKYLTWKELMEFGTYE